MTELRHPYDYSSIEEYLQKLQKVKKTLSDSLVSALRFGHCTKRIVNDLNYVRIMEFYTSTSEASTIEKDAPVYVNPSN